MLKKIALKDIVVKNRHRKDLGDIDALVASINDVGLLQPIVVDRDNRLIAGTRRVTAAEKAGWSEIPAIVIGHLDDAAKLLRAERDENVCRKDFTPSEAVALGRKLEALEKPRAEERKLQGLKSSPKRNGKNQDAIGSGKLPEPIESAKTSEKQDVSENTPSEVSDVDSKEKKHKRETRERVASAVGMSGKTYEKAKAVTEAAEQDPQRFGDLQERMDETGKVNAAFKELQRRQAEPKPDATVDADEDASGDKPLGSAPLFDQNDDEVPPQAYDAFNGLPELTGLLRLFDQLHREIARVGQLPVGRYMHYDSARQQVKAAKQTMHAGMPAYVCPYCKGQKEDCRCCRGCGFVTKGTYKQSPSELQKIKEGA